MKYFILSLTLIMINGNCASIKKKKVEEAYFQLKKSKLTPLLNFVIDTRGENAHGQLIVRSIRYFEDSNSYLLYPKIDTVVKNFCKKQKLSPSQLDTLVNVLFKHQSCTNASEINSNRRLGEFIYYSFENNNNVLVYCPDTDKVYNNYWKCFIANGTKVDPSWYIVQKSCK